MSENFWTFCLFATYPKKTDHLSIFYGWDCFCGVSSGYLRFTGVGIRAIKNDINILCIMYILSTHMLYIACTDNIATMPCRYCKIQL